MGNSAGPTAGIIVRRRILPTDTRSDRLQFKIQVAVILVILATLAFVSYLVLRYLRKSHPNPTYVPTEYLKRRWQGWHPRGMRLAKEGYSARNHENSSVPTLHLRSDNRNSRAASALILPDVERLAADEGAQANTTTAEVDRRTSVRSVVTLPAYSRSVRETERVLGREGERDGVDVVLEQPETADEEEARRDEEMEALYQIRAQRRREIDEREERRRERSSARDRGDVDTLRRMRQESALRAEEREANGTTAMIRDFRARSRERRVSSVSYADIGVARHDGSRLRANSNESDRPLLDSPANMGRHSLRPWATRSSLSVSGEDDDEPPPPPFGRAGSDFEVVTLHQTHSRATSRNSNITSHSRSPSSSRIQPPSIDTGIDLGESHIPTSNPPAYADGDFEEAPPYRSPDQARAPVPQIREERPESTADTPLLPEIHRLPSIRVAEATPINFDGSIEWPSSASSTIGNIPSR